MQARGRIIHRDSGDEPTTEQYGCWLTMHLSIDDI
jgi:hypothetical protein